MANRVDIGQPYAGLDSLLNRRDAQLVLATMKGAEVVAQKIDSLDTRSDLPSYRIDLFRELWTQEYVDRVGLDPRWRHVLRERLVAIAAGSDESVESVIHELRLRLRNGLSPSGEPGDWISSDGPRR